jgi:CheY-like chemotaxis protein
MTKEILIADSDKGDQEEFQKIFDSTDYKIIFSESGQETIARIKLFKPDLIIASKNISDRDVFDLCRSIKTDPEYKNIPCLLLSNFFEDISEDDLIDAGADGVLSRPLREDEILNLVDRFMEQPQPLSTEEITELKDTKWASFSESEKREEPKMDLFVSDELKLDEEEEEEIIELVDVVEEGEARLSIDDIIPSAKEEVIEKLSLQEPMERMEFEREVITKEETKPEDELFEKIELEEILQKVEQLKPSMEELQIESEAVSSEEIPTTFKEKEKEEEVIGFQEFESALKQEVKAEPIEEELPPLSFIESEERKGEEKEEEAFLPPIEEELVEEIPEEELPEEFFEEILKEEEIGVVEEPKAERIIEEVKEEKEIIPEEIKIERLEEIEAPKIIEEAKPLIRSVDKQLEEVILKGVQDMVSDFITKILPEMTQNILNLTMERIEKMVSEIVPDLAEKAIKEEIKRLKQGDKD